jgi:hypothetical protein
VYRRCYNPTNTAVIFATINATEGKVVHTWKIGVDNGNNPNLSMLISNGLSTDPKKLPVRQ